MAAGRSEASRQEEKDICCNEYLGDASYSYKGFESGRKDEARARTENVREPRLFPTETEGPKGHSRKGDQR
jgi:hypothetical protein